MEARVGGQNDILKFFTKMCDFQCDLFALVWNVLWLVTQFWNTTHDLPPIPNPTHRKFLYLTKYVCYALWHILILDEKKQLEWASRISSNQREAHGPFLCTKWHFSIQNLQDKTLKSGHLKTSEKFHHINKTSTLPERPFNLMRIINTQPEQNIPYFLRYSTKYLPKSKIWKCANFKILHLFSSFKTLEIQYFPSSQPPILVCYQQTFFLCLMGYLSGSVSLREKLPVPLESQKTGLSKEPKIVKIRVL